MDAILHQAINHFFYNSDATFVQLQKDIANTHNDKVKAMLILSGIDMMSQYYAGDIKNKRTSKRIKAFLVQMGKLSEQDAEMLFQYRNALFHHYGAVTYDSLADKKYHFITSSENKNLISKNNKNYHVSIEQLVQLNQEIVKNYLNSLALKKNIQTNFIKVFRHFQIT
jgi:hypothetical protein